MNDLEKLIWNHNKSGSATSYLLTPAELDEIVEAAIALGQDGIEAKEDAAYDSGFEEGKDRYRHVPEEVYCRECGISEARLCYECFDE